jgi:hypothetical protein
MVVASMLVEEAAASVAEASQEEAAEAAVKSKSC